MRSKRVAQACADDTPDSFESERLRGGICMTLAFASQHAE